ncbi:hypothetical protein P0082_06395 [Candidatus Haliotispira prima]|uniref:Curli production assembly/transport component CsgG n=1 Tax=Candidatus Haliotispira prima TaxID=3034016 RepID=A0ABY8MEY1_9SPIO|nr:hypothetical protein P0082_06395 [Candidatus Haliotispira prima]
MNGASVRQRFSFLCLCLALTVLAVLAGCASGGGAKPGTGITNFPLTAEGQDVSTLIVAFDSTWKVYPEGAEAGSGYEDTVGALRSQLGKGAQLLFFGSTKTDDFQAQTQYIINKRPDVKLDAYIGFLMGSAYGHVEKAKNLGKVETVGGIEGRLLQYIAKGMIYFEFIYRVESFFLRTAISTPIATYESQEEFNGAKNYILEILRSISTKDPAPTEKKAPQTTEADAQSDEAADNGDPAAGTAES